MNKYLTVTQISERIHYAPQTLYNMIYKGVFVIGVHYVKPTRKKILFDWSQVEAWLTRGNVCEEISGYDQYSGTPIIEPLPVKLANVIKNNFNI